MEADFRGWSRRTRLPSAVLTEMYWARGRQFNLPAILFSEQPVCSDRFAGAGRECYFRHKNSSRVAVVASGGDGVNKRKIDRLYL